MNKHAAAKKSVFEAPMTYLMVAVLFTGLMIGAMLPSHATSSSPTEKSVNYNQAKYIGSGIGPDGSVVNTRPYVTKAILPALPLGEGFERFDK